MLFCTSAQDALRTLVLMQAATNHVECKAQPTLIPKIMSKAHTGGRLSGNGRSHLTFWLLSRLMDSATICQTVRENPSIQIGETKKIVFAESDNQYFSMNPFFPPPPPHAGLLRGRGTSEGICSTRKHEGATLLARPRPVHGTTGEDYGS